MQAVILIAGYGSRLERESIPHKVLLPFGNDTLLSRHLSCLEALDPERVHLVLGHNKEAVREYVNSLDSSLPLNFIENDDYLTTGNTLSMVMGLRQCRGDVLVMDGDVLYPRNAFLDYVRKAAVPSFAVVDVSIDDVESSKVLLHPSGSIHAFVTKRDLTPEEKSTYRFAGEAIGFFKLSGENIETLISLYEAHSEKYVTTLWEEPLTELAQRTQIAAWHLDGAPCFEIDTEEDYQAALACYLEQSEQFNDINS